MYSFGAWNLKPTRVSGLDISKLDFWIIVKRVTGLIFRSGMLPSIRYVQKSRQKGPVILYLPKYTLWFRFQISDFRDRKMVRLLAQSSFVYRVGTQVVETIIA